MTIMNPRETYLAASVSTATPSQLLVMLYERLVLDVQRAIDAMRRGEPSQAHGPLLHAQEIVLELNASLKVDAWDGARGLASLYDYLHSELVKANVAKDLKTAEFCLHLVTALRDTWRDAAGSLLAESA
jgi:flagellar protein FliS